MIKISHLLFLFTTVFGIVSGARLPRRSQITKRQQESFPSFSVDGGDLLKTYVCSPDTSKQESSEVSLHKRLDIPPGDLQCLWDQAYALLAHLSAILGKDGNLTCLPTLIPHPSPFQSTPNVIPVILDPPRVSPIVPLPPATIDATTVAPPPLAPSPVKTDVPFHPTFPDPFRPLSSLNRFTNTSVILPTGNLNGSHCGINASSTYLLGTWNVLAPSTPTLNAIIASVVAPSTTNSPRTHSLLAVQPPANTPLPPPSPPTRPSFTGLIVTPFLPISPPSPTSLIGDSPTNNDSPSPQQSSPLLSPPSARQSPPEGPAPPTPSNPPTSEFNAQSPTNIAVYYGQTAATSQFTLAQQCADPNVDIVILAFVTQKIAQGSLYPAVNFGAACGGQTDVMQSEASGLLWCPGLGNDILSCQRVYGKKVLLSMGGATSDISFTSDDDAAQFGNTLWNLFGPDRGAIDSNLRPFGQAVIDGFDIDNENNNSQFWPTLAMTLRSLFTSAPSTPQARQLSPTPQDLSARQSSPQRTFYLSSAPQCPFPDASNPTPLLLLCDFVFVQFYNNPPCELGSPNFLSSLTQWSKVLAPSPNGSGSSGSGRGGSAITPRIFIGAPSFSAAGPTAYQNLITGIAAASAAEGNEFTVPVTGGGLTSQGRSAGLGSNGEATAVTGLAGFKSTAAEISALGLPNFGGWMFWDGPEGEENVGRVFGEVKEGLVGR